MPGMPTHQCNAPGCPESTATRYCPKHTTEANVKDDHDALYTTHKWRTKAKAYLAKHPFCMCKAPECGHDAKLGCLNVKTAEVDHIIPRTSGGSTWDEANWQRLCKPCHSVKTRRERNLPRVSSSRLTAQAQAKLDEYLAALMTLTGSAFRRLASRRGIGGSQTIQNWLPQPLRRLLLFCAG